MERKPSKVLKEITDKLKKNPVVEHLDDEYPFERVTTDEKIKDFHRYLVQKTIDYIRENGLTDIVAVRFNADDLQESAAYGEWTPATDSYLGVEGVKLTRLRRKDGFIEITPELYKIGESY